MPTHTGTLSPSVESESMPTHAGTSSPSAQSVKSSEVDTRHYEEEARPGKLNQAGMRGDRYSSSEDKVVPRAGLVHAADGHEHPGSQVDPVQLFVDFDLLLHEEHGIHQPRVEP